MSYRPEVIFGTQHLPTSKRSIWRISACPTGMLRIKTTGPSVIVSSYRPGQQRHSV